MVDCTILVVARLYPHRIVLTCFSDYSRRAFAWAWCSRPDSRRAWSQWLKDPNWKIRYIIYSLCIHVVENNKLTWKEYAIHEVTILFAIAKTNHSLSSSHDWTHYWGPGCEQRPQPEYWLANTLMHRPRPRNRVAQSGAGFSNLIWVEEKYED